MKGCRTKIGGEGRGGEGERSIIERGRREERKEGMYKVIRDGRKEEMMGERK